MGASVQAEPVTNSLLIQADALTTKRVIDFAKEMDERVAAVKPERRCYSLANAAPRDVVSAITGLFGGSGGGRRTFRGAAIGEQVKAVIVGSQVVVDAPATKQLEIASLIEQLDELGDQGIRVNAVRPGLIYTDMHASGGEAARVDRLPRLLAGGCWPGHERTGYSARATRLWQPSLHPRASSTAAKPCAFAVAAGGTTAPRWCLT